MIGKIGPPRDRADQILTPWRTARPSPSLDFRKKTGPDGAETEVLFPAEHWAAALRSCGNRVRLRDRKVAWLARFPRFPEYFSFDPRTA